MDVGRAITPRQERETHVQQVKALLRERAQTERTSKARAQRRDAEGTWSDPYWKQLERERAVHAEVRRRTIREEETTSYDKLETLENS